MEKIRLSKLMSQRGLCSRREADLWISQKLVKVNGETISTLGARVDPDCTVTLEKTAKEQQRKLVTILLNKPVGFVSGQPEKGYSPASSLVTRANHFRGDQTAFFPGTRKLTLAPAGRLDIDSSGLLVLTQDGRVARALISPVSSVEKEYLVRISGQLDSHKLALLHHGLELDGRKLKPAGIKVMRPQLIRFVLVEGRKRQIRRMCNLLDLQVTSLKRVRIGNVQLGGLPRGQWRYLGPDEKF